jgi:uncharacterized protein
MRILIIIVVVPIVLISIGFGFLYKFQEKLIFFPEKLRKEKTFQFNGDFTERYFTMSDNEIIHTLHFTVANPKGLIFYLHGNAGSMASWGHVADDFTAFQYDVLIIDYRGYGKSSGSINDEKTLYSDSIEIYEAISKDYSTIYVYGRSIGTGIASHLASKMKSTKLILETPYYSFPDLVSKIYPFLPSFLLRYDLNNAKYLTNLQIPVHLIHGTKDEIIPYDSSVRLEKIGQNISLHTLQGGFHNDLPFHKKYRNIIQSICQ